MDGNATNRSTRSCNYNPSRGVPMSSPTSSEEEDDEEEITEPMEVSQTATTSPSADKRPTKDQTHKETADNSKSQWQRRSPSPGFCSGSAICNVAAVYSNSEGHDDNEAADVPARRNSKPNPLAVDPNALKANIFYGDFFERNIAIGSTNNDDPDWKEFVADVEKSMETAHQSLFLKLRKFGPNSSAASALLYKLIGSFMKEYDFQQTHRSVECGATIVLSLLHYVNLADFSYEATVNELAGILRREIPFFPTHSLEIISRECMTHLEKQANADEPPLDPVWIQIFVSVVDVLHGKRKLHDGQLTLREIISKVLELPFTNQGCISILILLRSLPGKENSHVETMFTKIKTFIADNMKIALFPIIIAQLLLAAPGEYLHEIVGMGTKYFNGNWDDPEQKLKCNVLGTTIARFFDTQLHQNALLKVIQYHRFDFDKFQNVFNLTLFLRLSEVPFLSEQIINHGIKMIKTRFQTNEFSNSSRWAQTTTGIDCVSVLECFRRLFQSRSGDFQFIHQGLLELAKGLLLYKDSSSLIQHQCSELGKDIYTSVVRSGDDTMLRQEVSYLLKAANTSQVHGETLADILRDKAAQLLMRDNLLANVHEIVEQISNLPSSSAMKIVVSLREVFRRNHDLRNHLLLKLRKSVGSRQENIGMSFAKITSATLSYAHLAGELPMSQFSQHLSQLRGQSTDEDSLPEILPICLELLTLTARSLVSAPSTVKAELYRGFPRIVRANPSLVELICNQLHEHGYKLLIPPNTATDNPVIDFAQVIEFRDQFNNNKPLITVKTELGRMTQALCQVANNSRKTFDDIRQLAPKNLTMLEDLIGLWTRATLLTDVETIQSASSEVILEQGVEAEYEFQVAAVFNVQMRQIIESLIEFLMHSSNEGSATIIKKLFVRYVELAEPTTMRTEKACKNKPDKGEKNVKNVKVSATNKMPFPHVYYTESLPQLFKKFYGQSTPLNDVSRNSGDEFETMLLHATNQAIDKSKPNIESLKSHDAVTFANVARSIWRAFWESSIPVPTEHVLMLRLSTLRRIATTTSIPERLVELLCNGITGETSSYEQNFLHLFNSWQRVFDASSHVDDFELRASLLDLLCSFANPVIPISVAQTISAWCWDFMKSSPAKSLDPSTPPSRQLAESAIGCWLTFYMKGYSDLKRNVENNNNPFEDVYRIAREIALAADLHDAPRMWILNTDTVHVCVRRIWELVGAQLELMNVLVGKFDLSIDINDSHCSLFESYVGRLRQILAVFYELVKSRVLAQGELINSVSVPIITTLFSLTNGLAKHLKGIQNTVQFHLLAQCFVPGLEFVESKFIPAVRMMGFVEQTTFNRKMSQAEQGKPIKVKSKLASDKRLYPLLSYQIEALQQTFLSLNKKLNGKHNENCNMEPPTRKRRKLKKNDTGPNSFIQNKNSRPLEPIAGPSKPRSAPTTDLLVFNADGSDSD